MPELQRVAVGNHARRPNISRSEVFRVGLTNEDSPPPPKLCKKKPAETRSNDGNGIFKTFPVSSISKVGKLDRTPPGITLEHLCDNALPHTHQQGGGHKLYRCPRLAAGLPCIPFSEHLSSPRAPQHKEQVFCCSSAVEGRAVQPRGFHVSQFLRLLL